MFVYLLRSGNQARQGLLFAICDIWILGIGVMTFIDQQNIPYIISGILFILAWITAILFGRARARTYAIDNDMHARASKTELKWLGVHIILLVIATILIFQFNQMN